MTIPVVTFPLTQEQIATEYKRLNEELKKLNAEIQLKVKILNEYRSFCQHPNKTKYRCLDCGKALDME